MDTVKAQMEAFREGYRAGWRTGARGALDLVARLLDSGAGPTQALFEAARQVDGMQFPDPEPPADQADQNDVQQDSGDAEAPRALRQRRLRIRRR
ncbi:hypothetical protein [Caldinitratiruptor microaerophilus]|uniref:Uncharacterized protein n=1 Tax=Caldinitratiruptor microaerophilus TaxID=671077 RepID=A0AA35CIT5_9FIRM|nr:hypothetical protein [Caldinitratiruptor microaerophilus]BDG59912.1 hypothetical protein caldi_10020 [Caldinitratiruptor microaerophilus]